MSVDFNRPEGDTTNEPMFAPTPAWERNGKRSKGLFGAKKTTQQVHHDEPRVVAAEPRSFTSDAPAPKDTFVAAPATRVEARPSDGDLAGDAPFAGGAPFARTTSSPAKSAASHRSNSALGLAIGAGVVAVGALAVGGWYMSQPRESGVDTIAPATVATAPAETPMTPAPESSPGALAVNDTPPPAPPAAAPERTVRREAAPVRTARARPAAAPSVEDAAMNASATMPSAPVPYSATGEVAPPPANVAPATAAPATAAPAAAPTPLAVPPVTTPPATVTPTP